MISRILGLLRPKFPLSLGQKIIGWVQARIYGLRLQQQQFELAAETMTFALLEREKHKDPRDVVSAGFAVYSQFDEDGIIEEICRRLVNVPNRFLEIGTGGAERVENNTLYLLLKGWTGAWIEGDAEDARSLEKVVNARGNEFGGLTVINTYVNPQNINPLLTQIDCKADTNLGVLSIDIDSIDLDIIEALEPFEPAIVVVEYNAKYRPGMRFRVQIGDPEINGKTSYFGASLDSFRDVLESRGYQLVACGLTGANAYFVREDLATPQNFYIGYPTSHYYEPPRYYLAWGRRNGMYNVMALGISGIGGPR